MSLQPSLHALHLVPKVDIIEASIASSCLSPRGRAFRGNTCREGSRAVRGLAHGARRVISGGWGGERGHRAAEARDALHVNSGGLVEGGARRCARHAARNQQGTERGTGAPCGGGAWHI